MKNCIKVLLVTSLVLGLTACNEEKKNNVTTDYRVDVCPEIRNSAVHQTQVLPEQQAQQTNTELYDNRQVHQVANARFEREAAYQERERAAQQAALAAEQAAQSAAFQAPPPKQPQ